jgi:hypothetical protein
MTISDRIWEAKEAQGTAGSALVKATPLFIAVAALLAQASAQVPQSAARVLQSGTGSSAALITARPVDERDILQQIHRVYDDLLQTQVDLDADAKRALYSNLWDVTTEDRLFEKHALADVAGTFGGPAWEELLEIVERNRRKGR